MLGEDLLLELNWVNGSFYNSGGGISTTSVNYQRINPPIHQLGKLRVVCKEGVNIQVREFSAPPVYTNNADNTAIYLGSTASGRTADPIEIELNPEHYYVVETSILKNSSGQKFDEFYYPPVYIISNRLDKLDDEVAQLVTELERKADLEAVVVRSSNLLDIRDVKASSACLTSTGKIVTSSTYANYWVSGAIPVDPAKAYYISRQAYSVVFRDANGAVTGYHQNNNVYGAQVPPAGTVDMVLTFTNATGPETISVYDTTYAGGFEKTFNDVNEVKPLYASEVLTANKNFFVMNDGSGLPVIISALVKGTGSVKFRYASPHRANSASSGFYTSMEYPIAAENYEQHEWRVPPFPDGAQVMIVGFTVTSGNELDLKWLRSRFDGEVRHNNITHHCHFGVYSKRMTVQDAEDAARMGFKSFIMVPKKTADGVFVAFHDDASIGNVFRTDDGAELDAATKTKMISDFTLAELKQWDIGRSTAPCLAGRRIATIDELFAVCARTGMKPMFSVHGLDDFNNENSEATWTAIKVLLEKHGLLSRMQVKVGNDPWQLNRAHNVLGDDIDSYILDWSMETENPISTLHRLSWYDPLLCKVEFFEAQATEAAIKAAVAEGLTVSSAETTRSVARMKQLISWGVTEFTEDSFYSFGLNY